MHRMNVASGILIIIILDVFMFLAYFSSIIKLEEGWRCQGDEKYVI